MKSNSMLMMELCETNATAKHSMNTMESLRKDEKHCDAVIEAGGEKFKIHKSVFAIYSDYFDKVFTVEMQEKYSSVVKLADTRCDVMEGVVDFIYTGQLSINCENAIELLVAADYLHIQKIKELSVEFLLNNVDAETCVSIWVCAKTYGIEDLEGKSLMFFEANMICVVEKYIDSMNSETFVEIMESSKEYATSHEESFRAAAIWANFDSENRKDAFSKVFQNFNLSDFSKDFLLNIARTEQLVSTSTVLLQNIIVELDARLNMASVEKETANKKHARLEKACQKSNKRVVGLIKENQRLSKLLNVRVNDVEQAERQQKESRKKVDELTEENKRLNKQLKGSVKSVEEIKHQLKSSAKRIESLINENKQLVKKVHESENYSEQAARQQQGLNRKIDQLLKENRELSVLPKKHISIDVKPRHSWVAYEGARHVAHEIRHILNDPTNESFWGGCYLSEKVQTDINIRLDSICRLRYVATYLHFS